MWRLTVLLGVLVPASAVAQTSEGAPKQEAPAGQLTKAPVLLKYVEAVYPPEALKERITGEVILVMDIDDKGAVTAVEVSQGAGHGFDEAATEAVRQFVFSPAEIDGKPAPVRITYRYGFTLAAEKPAEATKPAAKGEANFRGRVLERGTRRPLVGAEVVLDDAAFTAVTGPKGTFEFKDLPPKEYAVIVNVVEYLRFETEEEVVSDKITEATYYVRRRAFSPYETVIRGERERKEVARIVMSQEEIKLIPGTQGDALRVVQNLPGVARAPYGFGVLLVRGGRDFDTRTYLDGSYVPLLFHFGGLTSTFNADLLENITFLPGNFGVKNGRAVAGTVEANVRVPSQDTYHGYLDANLIHSGLLLEGPITEGWSFAVSGRRSYVDFVLGYVDTIVKRFNNDRGLGVTFMVAPVYWDYQAVLSYSKKGAPDRLSVSLFGSSDASKFVLSNAAMVDPEGRSDITLGIEYHRLAATWTRPVASSLTNSLHLTLGYSRLDNSFGVDLYLYSNIYTVALREALTWEASKQLSFEAGLDVMSGRFDYETSGRAFPRANEFPDLLVSREMVFERERQLVAQPAVYLEAVIKPHPQVKLVPGLRADFDSYLRDGWIDPRLVGFWTPFERTTLKAGLGLFQQSPDWRYGASSRTFGNPDLNHESSCHAMVGVEQRLTESISADVQVYYKHMWNLVMTSSNTTVRDGQEVLERFNNGGRGRAYGVELLLRHELTRRFFGWIAYSLSRTERAGGSTFGEGWRLWSMDQTHNLIAVLSYKLPYDWIVGTRLRYATGIPNTVIRGGVLDADVQRYLPVIPEQSNTERVPDFFQVDVRVDKRFVFQDWSITAYLDVQNLFNQQNPEATTYNFDYTKHAYISGLPIIPSIGLKGEF